MLRIRPIPQVSGKTQKKQRTENFFSACLTFWKPSIFVARFNEGPSNQSTGVGIGLVRIAPVARTVAYFYYF